LYFVRGRFRNPIAPASSRRMWVFAVPSAPMSVLDEIRHAAFELRRTDPQEAVRVLRRAAASGGDAEVLARGALGEIYLEEFGDLDGAESEFRKVLAAAPGLAAAQIGLARTRREAGDFPEADACFVRALEGLSHDLAGFRDGKELPPGAEEVVLTVLEVAVELAELRAASGHDKELSVPLDEELLQWAATGKLFDAEGDLDDWIRFHSLWTQLRLLSGRAEEALAAVREAERGGELPPPESARLLSLSFEDLGDQPRAGAEARRRLELLPAPWPLGEVVRAAHLLGPAGRELLEKALPHWPPQSEEAAALREALGAQPLIQLVKKD
jgi:tetratricopeptide (TPR) repeat protein